ncbi:WD40/YVTN/BNR-like repeat-containing protein [Foetidibacter luteolus]|uniref:WD40/YVTN/BNR-like repeat-containing protein n=1 Tax=Foetidibacter luteolus TaxID=2608880 RepID=UPI00129AFA41|nr:sialidase family protein [Foetidibacter luteolus]
MTDDMIANSLKSKFTLSQYDKLGNIMQFNKDTFLISGYLADNSTYNTPKNVVFQTFDGGKNWKKNHFKGDAWIYNTHFQEDGKVWMGGSDEYIHYSSDYGTTWAVKPKPFNPINRVLSIYMTDSLNGIAGGLHNGLAITNDNWQTTKQIPSPLDQNKFSITKNSARNRIDKVQIVDSTILIDQNDHIYYSKLNQIDWRTFNIPTRNFCVNQSKKSIELYSIRNKVYVLDSKLNLLETYIQPEDIELYESQQNGKIDVASFLSSNIKLTSIKAVKFDFDKMSGGCIPFALYKENSKGLKVKNSESFSALCNILTTCEDYEKPIAQSFKFSEQDVADYFSYYNKLKAIRQEEKVWGGDFTYLLNIDNNLFLNPNKTIDTINQQLLDTVYKTFSLYPFSFTDNEPYIIVNVVNNKSDTLKITSKNSSLFSLPWTIEYKGHSFETYDTRVTELLKSTLPKGFNYYDKLFAGELIYRLIEQRIINEMTYKNGY